MPARRSATTIRISVVLLVLISAVPCLGQELTLHVARSAAEAGLSDEDRSFSDPQHAIAALARLAEQSPAAQITILLHDGVYRITQPLTIRRQDVPPRGAVTLAAAEGERVTISGGKLIADWTIDDDGSWVAAPPEATEGKWTFRELFVSGQRRPRARHPNAGYVRVDEAFDDKRSGFTFNEGDLPGSWREGGELVFLHDWSTSRIPVKSVVHEGHRLTTAFPIGNRADHYRIDHFEPHARYYVENHKAFLDAPGEWLLDAQGKLRYRPLPGETPDSIEAAAPVANQLLKVTGDEIGPVRNVHVRGLRFEHCGWQLPTRGLAASQATAHEARDDAQANASRRFVPAAIQVERAEDCSFTACRIAHLGTSGIEFGSRTAHCRLEDSVVVDVSGNGVNLGEDASRMVDGERWWQVAPEQAALGNVVRNNRVERCGQQLFGAVAVWVGLVRDARIENNEIADHPYTGVSLGWMWNPTPSPAGGNVVSANHIHHVLQVLSDGGGIYTLGRQPETRLTDNVIHDVPLNAGRAESNGMFLDEGSDQIEIARNVIYGTVRSPLRFHRAEQLTVRDNVLVLPTSDTPPLRYNNTDPQTIMQSENRIPLQAEFDPASIELPATGPR